MFVFLSLNSVLGVRQAVLPVACAVCVLKQIPSVVPQVFGEGVDSVKKSLEGIFDDTVPDGKVKPQLSSCLLPPRLQPVNSE